MTAIQYTREECELLKRKDFYFISLRHSLLLEVKDGEIVIPVNNPISFSKNHKFNGISRGRKKWYCKNC